MFDAGPGGLRVCGRRENGCPPEGEVGSSFTPSAPVEVTRPARGAGNPPNVSHGEPFWSASSDWLAWATATGFGLLPPSMKTRPARPLAPGFPLKSHVA